MTTLIVYANPNTEVIVAPDYIDPCPESPGGVHDGVLVNYYYELRSGTKYEDSTHVCVVGKYVCSGCGEAIYIEGIPGAQIGYYVFGGYANEVFSLQGVTIVLAEASNIKYTTSTNLSYWSFRY
ncbi:MAG: hypothetical protein ACM3TR_04565 [Caulobacteraceae bacterium]